MFIETLAKWEIDAPFYASHAAPGKRIYPFVEIPFNDHLFHVDILPIPPEKNEPALWVRLITGDIQQAFILIADEHVQQHRLSIQSRRQKDAEYHICVIDEILQAESSDSTLTYIYISSDGTRISSRFGYEEDELLNTKSIYKRGQNGTEKNR